MPDIESFRNLFEYTRYAHGLYNGIVILLFLYQGSLGLKIRQERNAGRPPQATYVRRHRKFGPSLVILAIFGFAGGISSVHLSEGEIFQRPAHFLTGLTICALIIATSLVSRRIRGREDGLRTTHYVIGVMILLLYFIQAFIGISMLL